MVRSRACKACPPLNFLLGGNSGRNTPQRYIGVYNPGYKIREKADETVIILEPYTILFRICFWSWTLPRTAVVCSPPWAVVTVPY